MALIKTDKGGGLKKFLDFVASGFRTRNSRENVLAILISQISLSVQEVRAAKTRLEIRYNNLFRKAIEAKFFKKEGDRALIYANEAVQVKRMHKKIVFVEKLLEQVKLRLETIEDVSNISIPIMETAKMLSVAKDYVKDVMPSIALNIDSLISETRKVLSETVDVTEINTESALEIDPAARELLERLDRVAAETTKNKLPEIPMDLLLPGKEKSLEVKIKESSIKLAAPPKIRVKRIKPHEIDQSVLEYALTHGGFIDVGDIAARLGVSRKEVMESLHRLREQNKIAY